MEGADLVQLRQIMNRTTGTQPQLRCLSCKESYTTTNIGTCKECYEEASETKEELKKEIEELKSKVSFLRLSSVDSHKRCSSVGFTDVELVAIDEFQDNPLRIPAHKAVLASRSSVFKAMLENEMKESLSGTINISDVSYDTLRAFINYLYTAEANLDDQMACDLLVLAEIYQVKHLKSYCEIFLVSKLNWENSVERYSFAHQHHAKQLLESALSMILENMENLTESKEYARLVENDPKLVIKIYEAYMSKSVKTAARTN